MICSHDFHLFSLRKSKSNRRKMIYMNIQWLDFFVCQYSPESHLQNNETWIYFLHLYILTEKTDSQDNSIRRIYIIVLFLQSIQFLFFSLFLFLKISYAFHGLSFIVWPWAIPFRKVIRICYFTKEYPWKNNLSATLPTAEQVSLPISYLHCDPWDFCDRTFFWCRVIKYNIVHNYIKQFIFSFDFDINLEDLILIWYQF